MALRASARPGLTSGQFRHGPVHVTGSWSELDADDPKVREVLLQFVPSYIRLMPGQDRELEAHGLELRDARLADVRAEKSAAEKAAKEKAAAPKK